MANKRELAESATSIQQRLANSAVRGGRRPESITLMAVSKTVEPERIRAAYNAGLRVFGENRVQEFADKSPGLSELKDAEWHLIGHLQSNKARKAAELFQAVDSVDSLRLAEKLDKPAGHFGKFWPGLSEITIDGEGTKSRLAAY